MTELLLFAKYWEPGLVKTRLARVVGESEAADLHRLFVSACLKRLADVGDRRTVVFWPPSRQSAFERLGAGAPWGYRPQVPGNLGERMRAAISEAMNAGATAVVLLGADSPTLPLAWVHEAVEALNHHEVVVGPAADGGYYLLGTTLNRPEFFEGIPWSTGQVLSQTLDQIQNLNPRPRCRLLPEWYDVDEEPELRRLAFELHQKDASDLLTEGLGPLAQWLSRWYRTSTDGGVEGDSI